MTTISTTHARDLVWQLFSILDQQRWDQLESVVRADVAVTTPFAELRGAAEWQGLLSQFAVAMPDGAHELIDVVSGDGHLAAWGRWSGTHTGPLATPGGVLPATGRRVELAFCAVARIGEDGRLTRIQTYLDQLAMMTQLGLAPGM
jgi:predicted ester cyclase